MSLGQILSTEPMSLDDTSPAAVAGYVAGLREVVPERRIAAAVRRSRAQLALEAGPYGLAAPHVPLAPAWPGIAAQRYGQIPEALRGAEFDPDFLPSLEEFDVARSASLVAFALESSGMRWALDGDLAGGAQGEPAPVFELAFLAEWDPARLPAFVKQLGEPGTRFWFEGPALRAAAERRAPAVLFQVPNFVRVVISDARDVPLGTQTLDRRVRVEGSSCGRMWVADAETLLLRTLAAWRDADDGEERLWRRAAMILAVQGPALDQAFVDARAAELDLAETLASLREQAAG